MKDFTNPNVVFKNLSALLLQCLVMVLMVTLSIFFPLGILTFAVLVLMGISVSVLATTSEHYQFLFSILFVRSFGRAGPTSHSRAGPASYGRAGPSRDFHHSFQISIRNHLKRNFYPYE